MPHSQPGEATPNSNHDLSQKVEMCNFETGHYIPYSKMASTLSTIRSRLNRPLTYAEKLLFSHLDDPFQDLERGESILKLGPDRVFSHDATAQMVILQFMSAGIDTVATPTTVHCDHLITAKVEAIEDLGTAMDANKEVYEFLSSACKKYNIGFWKPGSGIMHQTMLENYAFPGGLLVGTDSHTPNAGGVGMCAIGVGGAEAVDVLAGLPWEVKAPRIVGVRLTGKVNGWTAPKDIILKLAGILTVKGGTGNIIEYFGPGVETLSCTGMATICNMGAEMGSTTSIFPFTEKTYDFLVATGRKHVGDFARMYADGLRMDEGAEAYYDRIIDIDLGKLEPHINGPFSPDLATPIGKFKDEVRKHGWPENISVGLIGSCTNASYEDMDRAAGIARDAMAHGLTVKSKFKVTPGSEQIRSTLERGGQLKTLRKIGGVVLANACGPCIGNWDRLDVKTDEPNSIISSYNRNFAGRNDGNAATHAFVTSPEIATAMTIAGTLSFNPLTDSLRGSDGTAFKLSPPSGDSLPSTGYSSKTSIETYQGPPENRSDFKVAVSPTSERLQVLEPFAPWDGKDALDLPILIKTKGKTTTDDISKAGPWLKYRGHLDNISNNTYIGAVNAANNQRNKVLNCLTKKWAPVPATAREYKAAGLRWVVIGDYNFGEGSSREHAALQPRYLNGFAIIARSFARIHETNLKKQGLLPLRFSDPDDYERIGSDDRIDVLCADLEVGKPVILRVRGAGGEVWEVETTHTLSESQIEWFRDGSAMNTMGRLAEAAKRG